jgi:hypothetical protein
MDREKTLMEFPWLVNKLSRIFGAAAFLAAVQAAGGVDDLIVRIYGLLRVGGYEAKGSEVRTLCRLFEQYVNMIRRMSITTGQMWGASSAACDTTVTNFTTVNTASAITDLRYSVASLITQTAYDATIESDPNLSLNFPYVATA